MFLFRDRQHAATGKDAAAAASAPRQDAAAASGTREFLALKAARFLGGAARQVGASLAGAAKRVTVSVPTVEVLRDELENRALTSTSEELTAAVSEWAKLLAAVDDTPRYEGLDGGSPLTFRTAFLWSRAYELVLAAASSGSGPSEASPASPEGSAWRAFLHGTTLPGGHEVALELPELLAVTRNFPDCRRWVEEAALAVKADPRTAQLRSERAAAGTRAEELRASLKKGTLASSAACATSKEAVSLYATFRHGLLDAIEHLKDNVLTARRIRLQTAQEALGALCEEAECCSNDAAARREELLRQKNAAVAEPRRAVEQLERDPKRLEIDEHARELEEQRRGIQMELEEISQALASQRDKRLALQRRKEAVISEHRQRAEATEWQLRELRPSQHHGAIAPRAASMTEGEIIDGLGNTTQTLQGFITAARTAATAAATKHRGDLATQRAGIEQQVVNVLRDHAQLELARLDAAGAAVTSAVAALVDCARSRAASAAMGLDPEDALPSRRDVEKLHRTLAVARAAWEEADAFWGSAEVSKACGERILEVAAEAAPAATAALEASRRRIAQALEELLKVDPGLYDIALHGDGPCDGADEAALERLQHLPDCDGPRGQPGPELPHGWEAHATDEGDVYYYSLVTEQTQWEQPEQDAAVEAGWRIFQSDEGHWFYHNPYDGASLWYPELPTYSAEPAPLEALLQDARRG